MILVPDVFEKITPPENMVRKMSEKRSFRGPLESQQGKWVETLSQSELQHL